MDGFPFVFPVDVRFRDLDALGHVNNVVYLTYMESARLGWWMRTTGQASVAGVSMILARTEIDYRRAASFGERLLVGVRCASMRRSSFVLEFRIEGEKDGGVVAEARKVLVHYDYRSGRSTPIPPALRQQIQAQDPGVREEG